MSWSCWKSCSVLLGLVMASGCANVTRTHIFSARFTPRMDLPLPQIPLARGTNVYHDDYNTAILRQHNWCVSNGYANIVNLDRVLRLDKRDGPLDPDERIFQWVSANTVVWDCAGNVVVDETREIIETFDARGLDTQSNNNCMERRILVIAQGRTAAIDTSEFSRALRDMLDTLTFIAGSSSMLEWQTTDNLTGTSDGRTYFIGAQRNEVLEKIRNPGFFEDPLEWNYEYEADFCNTPPMTMCVTPDRFHCLTETESDPQRTGRWHERP
ncbi:MAG: hypothetical protein O7D91_14250 [Planctomycetota bacterium]|nr:hypothetical protein [Planctomycetota bacterium]